jgi:hypothetical protein
MAWKRRQLNGTINWAIPALAIAKKILSRREGPGAPSWTDKAIERNHCNWAKPALAIAKKNPFAERGPVAPSWTDNPASPHSRGHCTSWSRARTPARIPRPLPESLKASDMYCPSAGETAVERITNWHKERTPERDFAQGKLPCRLCRKNSIVLQDFLIASTSGSLM